MPCRSNELEVSGLGRHHQGRHQLTTDGAGGASGPPAIGTVLKALELGRA